MSDADDDIYENYDNPTLETTPNVVVKSSHVSSHTTNNNLPLPSIPPVYATVRPNSTPIPKRPTTADLTRFGQAVEVRNPDKCELEYNELFEEKHGKLHETIPVLSNCLNKTYDLVFKFTYVVFAAIIAPITVIMYGLFSGLLSASNIWIVYPLFQIMTYILRHISEFFKTMLRFFCIPCCQSLGYYWSMVVLRWQTLPNPNYDKTLHV